MPSLAVTALCRAYVELGGGALGNPHLLLRLQWGVAFVLEDEDRVRSASKNDEGEHHRHSAISVGLSRFTALFDALSDDLRREVQFMLLGEIDVHILVSGRLAAIGQVADGGRSWMHSDSVQAPMLKAWRHPIPNVLDADVCNDACMRGPGDGAAIRGNAHT